MKKLKKLILAGIMMCALCGCSPKAEDGQNPVMNFVGNYASGRASMLVEATDMNHGTKISVTWGSNAAEHSEWTMSGEFDEESLTVTYSDCTRKDVVFNEDGSIKSETVGYENGKGKIIFSEDGGLSLTWQDDTEHAADDMVFEYVSQPVE